MHGMMEAIGSRRKFPGKAAALVLLFALVPRGGTALSAVAGSGTGKEAGRKSAAPVTDNSLVAKANKEKVTVGQLREAMRELNWKHSKALLGEENAKQMALRAVVTDRLILQNMRASGKMEDPEYIGRMNGVRTVALGNFYLQAMARDYVPSDNEVQRYLPRYWRIVDVRVFFGGTSDEAEQARKEVEEGVDFAKIVRERSVGPGADRGGLLRNLRFGGSFLPEHLDHLVFTKEKGWISPIFENELGYCFLRIEKSEDIPPDAIEKQANSARAAATDDAIARMLDGEYRLRKVELDEDLLKSLDARPVSEWKRDFGRNLAHVDGEPVKVREFYWYLVTGISGRSPETIKGGMGELFRSFVRYRGVAQKAVREGMGDLPEMKKGMDSYSDKVLLAMFADGVKRSVKVTDKESREYFDRKQEAFRKPEGREVRVIALREERSARETVDLLRADPGKFGELVKERSVDPSTRRSGGKMGVVEKGRLAPPVETAVFGAKEGEVIGPIPHEELFYIFIVDRKIPALSNPKYTDFAREAREMALNDKVQEQLRAKRNDLYFKAAVETYPDVLERVEWPESGDAPATPPHGSHGKGH